MIVGVPRCSSIESWNTAPTAAAGMVDSTSSQAIRPSVSSGPSRCTIARAPAPR